LAAVLTVTLIFFTVLVPAMAIASAVATEAAQLYGRIERGEIDPGAILRWIQGMTPQISAWAEKIGVDVDGMPDRLTAAAVKGSQFIGALALTAGQNVARFLLMFALMLYLLFFVLRDGDEILEQIIRALPLGDQRERALFAKFAEMARAVIKGTLIVGLVQGTLGGLMFWTLGISGAVFWGMVMVLLSVLPLIGASIIWVPAAIFLAVGGAYGKAVIMVIVGAVVIGLADNVLRPLLVGRDTKMPDYLVLLSTLGGLTLFGLSGFVIGPIIASLFLAVWAMFQEEFAA
jgi:predicted PurR-regulated permease PerM